MRQGLFSLPLRSAAISRHVECSGNQLNSHFQLVSSSAHALPLQIWLMRKRHGPELCPPSSLQQLPALFLPTPLLARRAEVAELAVDAALAAVREGEGAGLAGAEGVEGRAYRRQARGPKLGCRQGVLEFQGAHNGAQERVCRQGALELQGARLPDRRLTAACALGNRLRRRTRRRCTRRRCTRRRRRRGTEQGNAAPPRGGACEVPGAGHA
mmetsp:Transcript_10184/g.35668  ORF Transcript_10184/g.35668 Transcript_10184/m.35668 type:complete len:212 (-) Transcript_10184:997-1632(-)